MKEVFERERRLLLRFRQRSLPFWAQGYPQTDWEHLFAMQHHGIPTRLLDWSENLFVALYFAAHEGDLDHAKLHKDRDCLPCVWLLDAKQWNRMALSHQGDEATNDVVLTTMDEEAKFYAAESQLDRFSRRYRTPVAIYGTHNSARIVAQRGTFTIAGNEWKGLEEFAKPDPSTHECGLWRLLFNGDKVRLRRDLHALGFYESMIYPDLVGLSRELTAMEDWRKGFGSR